MIYNLDRDAAIVYSSWDLHRDIETQLTYAMRNSRSKIFRQLMSIYRQTTSGAFCEQTVTNFKTLGHGFCAEGSHVVDSRAIFENSSWFESSFDFSKRENAQFQDGRFFLTTVKLMLSWKKWQISLWTGA